MLPQISSLQLELHDIESLGAGRESVVMRDISVEGTETTETEGSLGADTLETCVSTDMLSWCLAAATRAQNTQSEYCIIIEIC